MKQDANASGYRAVMDLAADMIWLRDLENGRILEINSAAERALGCPRPRLLGRSINEFYYDERGRSVGAEFAREVLRQGSALRNATFRTRARGPLEAEMRGSLVDYRGRKAVFVVARLIGPDGSLTRRALILYEAFRRSNDVMFYCDQNGTILDINNAFTQRYGYAREEAVGQTPRIIRSRHSTAEMYKRMWEQILDPRKGYWKGELINRAKNGKEIPVLLNITSVRNAEGAIVGYVSNAVDLSEQLALQARVAHSEALAQLGEMAAVVAHEIRNPLGSIVMAARQLASGKLIREDREMVLQVLKDEGQRLNETLSNLLNYARPRALKLERNSLNALVGEVCRMLKSNPDLLGSIKMTASLSNALDPFPMDADQVRQVFWNIALNAIQAMEGRGELAIETGRAHGQAFFRVKDTGPGIPRGSLKDIFKPFQTTKRQGTGLGLAVADRIVKSHGGRIKVESLPGRGAAFTVWLPTARE